MLKRVLSYFVAFFFVLILDTGCRFRTINFAEANDLAFYERGVRPRQVDRGSAKEKIKNNKRSEGAARAFFLSENFDPLESPVYTWGDEVNGGRVNFSFAPEGVFVLKYDSGTGWGCGATLVPNDPPVSDGAINMDGFNTLEFEMHAPDGTSFLILLDESGVGPPDQKFFKGRDGADGESYGLSPFKGAGKWKKYVLSFSRAERRTVQGNQHGNKRLDLQSLSGLSFLIEGNQGSGVLRVRTLNFRFFNDRKKNRQKKITPGLTGDYLVKNFKEISTWGDGDKGGFSHLSAEGTGKIKLNYQSGTGWGTGATFLPMIGFKQGDTINIKKYGSISFEGMIPKDASITIVLSESGVGPPDAANFEGINGADGESYAFSLIKGKGSWVFYRLKFSDLKIRDVFGNQAGNRIIDLQALQSMDIVIGGSQGEGELQIRNFEFVR